MNFANITDFYRQNINKNGITDMYLATVGIVDKIDELSRTTDINYGLFFSLHSPFNNQRDKIIPINRKFPVEKCIDACKRYAIAKRKPVKMNYLLFEGFNDSEEHISKLVRILDPELFEVRVLLYNQVKTIDFHRVTDKQAFEFRDKLIERGLKAEVIISRGRDISAGCGQLANKKFD